ILGLAVVLVALDEDRVALEDQEPGIAVRGEEAVDVAALVADLRFLRRALERARRARLDRVRRDDLVVVAEVADVAALVELADPRRLADRIAVGFAEEILVGRSPRWCREDECSEYGNEPHSEPDFFFSIALP